MNVPSTIVRARHGIGAGALIRFHKLLVRAQPRLLAVVAFVLRLHLEEDDRLLAFEAGARQDGAPLLPLFAEIP